MRFYLPFLALLFFSLPAHADIIWAFAGPLTGELAAWGQSGQGGIQQAVADINAAGGINGQKVILKTFDDACDPKQAVAIANKIASENIHFVVHGTCSAASIAALKTYMDEGTVVLNPFASNPKVTDEGGHNMFRTMYRDDNAALVTANYILKHEAGKKVAIIHDKSAYGLGIAQYVKAALNKGGIQEVAFQPYDPTNHDYSTLVTRLKETGTEALFMGGFPIEEAMIIRQMRDVGSKMHMYAGDLSIPDFWRVAGKAGDGTIFSFPKDPRRIPTAQNVIAALKKSGNTVDGYTLYPYAAAQVLAQASTKAGTESTTKVADEIHKSTFKTILGDWNFDAKGDITNMHMVIYRWHDGDFQEVVE